MVSGAAGGLSPADVDVAAEAIRESRVVVTQLEQPVAAAQRGLEIGRAAGSITVFNPAPAVKLDDRLFALCDYVVPNETEAEALTGIAVSDLAGARRAGDALLAKGAGTVLITLGERCFTGETARCTSRRSPQARWSKPRARAMHSSAASQARLRVAPVHWKRRTSVRRQRRFP